MYVRKNWGEGEEKVGERKYFLTRTISKCLEVCDWINTHTLVWLYVWSPWPRPNLNLTLTLKPIKSQQQFNLDESSYLVLTKLSNPTSMVGSWPVPESNKPTHIQYIYTSKHAVYVSVCTWHVFACQTFQVLFICFCNMPALDRIMTIIKHEFLHSSILWQYVRSRYITTADAHHYKT